MGWAISRSLISALFDKSLTTCFIKQYQQYANMSIDEASKTVSSNALDNGAVHLSYAAFESLKSGFKVGNYTPDQLFFIRYGQQFCAKHNSKTRLSDLAIGKSPEPFRVNVPLSNLNEFSKAFNCPIGSAMNPKDKCIVY